MRPQARSIATILRPRSNRYAEGSHCRVLLSSIDTFLTDGPAFVSLTQRRSDG